MGYQQQLRRGLGLFFLFAVSFSVISITTGIYTNFGFAIKNFGPASIWLWIWAVMAGSWSPSSSPSWLAHPRSAAVPASGRDAW